MTRKKSKDSVSENLTEDQVIVKEAKERFKRAMEWESDFRKLFIEDVKFGMADPDNQWAWPDAIRRNREIDDKPCLTINKAKQHCLQIVNDNRQHSPQIKIHPVGDGADLESAKILDGVVRHIEYRSAAQGAYNTAQEFSVFGGIGFWRVITEYISDDSFDQDIRISRVRDPMSVLLDPDIKEVDGSDANFAFVFSDLTKEEYKYKYGDKAAEKATDYVLDMNFGWNTPDHIRVAEYFRINLSKGMIAAVSSDDIEAIPGATTNVFKQWELDTDTWDVIVNLPNTKTRQVDRREIQYFKIAGEEIIERTIIPCDYIPIIRVVGEEMVIEGKLERKGHIRSIKDAQRMYNYWTSSAVEHVALQNKVPYIGPTKAFEGNENYWSAANTDNLAYLPYNHTDEAGNPIPRPERQQPPQTSQAYMQGMQVAANEMMMVTGQYQAVMGQQSNETSGIAIQNRQRQGDNATYHYIDHLSSAIRFTGRILVSMIPRVYDTPRILRILGEDGVEDFVHVDPMAQQALQKQQMQQQEEIKHILNPKIGTYDVAVDTGPAYSTRRQEAFAAMTQIMGKNGELMKAAGDLMFKAADFPMAQDIAERLNRMVPPQLKGEGPDPQVQALQQQLQQAQLANQKLMEAMDKYKTERESGMLRANADAYRAETDRAVAMHNAEMDRKQFIHDVATSMLQMQNQQNAGAVQGGQDASIISQQAPNQVMTQPPQQQIPNQQPNQ
ncbi:portal protein [Tolumonas lignilytica]|uniref:portal protein n=1 Tax=Tolumonas lignilytica TaxID=1283284 RepID=UPI00046688BC|nr:portal protein [Tolumonas lignilytica]